MRSQKYTWKKQLTYVFSLLILFAFCTKTFAQPLSPSGFPFYRSFLDGKMDNVTLMGPNPGYRAGVDRSNQAHLVKDLGLQLTYKENQIGALYLPHHPFTTNDGMVIEFEYMMYGGTGITDGITMFLADANYINSIKYGAEGAGFAYTHRWTNDNLSGQRIRGMQGGYLSIALDQANYKVMRMEGEEQRNGIAYLRNEAWSTSAKLTEYNTHSNVTIRGAAGQGRRYINSKYTMEDGYWGYPVLITRHTGGKIDSNFLRNSAGFRLRTPDGTFEKYVTPRIDKAFDIAGGNTFKYPSEPSYRKAIIYLKSNPDNTRGGFIITVAIQHQTDTTEVIKDFVYPETVTYIENGLPSRINNGFPVYYEKPPIINYSVDTPEKVVIGFAASTGTKLAYSNVIKNLRITPLYGAAAAGDDIRSHRRGPVTIQPLENDVAYKDLNGIVIAGKEYLDPSSFRFWSDEYTCLHEDVEYSVSEGKWVYDSSIAKVFFFPRKGFKGEVSIFYDIKGKEPTYDDEKFRSSLARINITINDNQP